MSDEATGANNPAPAPAVKIRLNKDGTASFEVAADCPERAFAVLDEVAAGLTSRGVLYGLAAAKDVAAGSIETAGAVAEARRAGGRR